MRGADGGANPDARPGRRWDVALSFAGSQRNYVDQVARALKARGVRCFYDADEEIDLWGKYLAEELPGIYSEQAAAVVVFVSAEYMTRDWTRVERRAALGRAVRERREYVLPARFDDTPLPGLLSGMVWVDLRGRAPEEFAAMIADKLAALGIALSVFPTGAKYAPPLPELPSDRTAAQRPRLIHTLSGRTNSWRELLSPTFFVSAAFSPNEQLLASGNTDRTVRLWDPATGEHLNTLAGHTGSVAGVAFSPDGLLLASSGDGTVRLWDPATGEHLRTLAGHYGIVAGVAFSPDGRLLASCTTGNDKKVRLWDPATGEHLRTLAGHTGPVWGVAFSPEGGLLASSSGHLDRTVRLWDPATGEHLRTLAGHDDFVIGVAFSPDGQLLAGHNGGGTVRLWDPVTGEHLRTLGGHNGGGGNVSVPAGNGVAFSPDGRLLASSHSRDGTVRLWDPATGKHLRTLAGHNKGVIGVAFSPDGRLLASCGLDNKLRVWEIPGIERQRNGQ